jgi:ribulose 1,5-bisphosphate carboxylase large subunit-like protein
MEPKMEDELVVATAAVGAQALEYLKEEHEVRHPIHIHPHSNPASHRAISLSSGLSVRTP